MKDTTLLFLIKKKEGKITDICLAKKKRGFGVGRWNGVGGKVHIGESVEDAVIRETEEEINVVVKNKDLAKIAELCFNFPHQSDWDQKTHVYFCESWLGDPVESEEMNPKWFRSEKLPFKEMWPDDTFWMPKVLEGDLIKGNFIFAEGDLILEHKLNSVDKFF